MVILNANFKKSILLLQLENISLTFGEDTLFDGISTIINPGERVGLVGPNGAGKSTLLKIIAGEINQDSGTINMSKAATVGYLPQDGVDPNPDLTVYEEVESAFEGIQKLEKAVQQAREKLANLDEGSPEYQKAMERVGSLQSKIERSGAYSLESNIEKILMGLGFTPEDFNRSTTEFSGGWLMRIALGKLLLQRPMYLLLDEPTNHLDIESLRWIEQFLSSYDGAVIIVSHDKAFLNKITKRTLALENGELFDYAGNFDYYKEKHADYKEHLRKAYENQQKEIKEIQEFIDKFRYNASKAAQVQSRIKQLEKMDIIELDEREEEIFFEFPPPERSGAVVMELEDVRKQYGKNVVFEDLSYTIDRGDKIAVVGPNGAGKSTLIRIISGIEDIDGGNREPGYNVTTSYFAQHQADELDLDKTVFEIMRDAAPKATETRLRTLLGCFLFQGDDVFKKVSVLSGGEKSRLALARMLLMPANFLIFDEPTNHLDMQSKSILQQALQQYEGAFMIVSHDRDFLDPIVDKTLEVRPETTNTFVGNVSYYLEKVEEREQEADASQDNSESNKKNGLSRKEERRIAAQKRQRKSKKLKPLKKKIEPLEEEIELKEERKQEIEDLMAQSDFYDDEDRVKEISMEYEKLKGELVEVYAEWEELAMKMSEIEEEFS
ncbi:ABC-F family ATP-binding cassette domain-containing protein [Fodinibius halophilus]|uniref:ABC-F family ATP-binding cassette domain-containing protein n=1 Tax=Fodinibius halophilus TaxID=1736908 RepID=UPI001F0EED6F|nr:ABC-F family ATP-binding cassette domain-containing protein [Fodinibius halophilus]